MKRSEQFREWYKKRHGTDDPWWGFPNEPYEEALSRLADELVRYVLEEKDE